MEELFRAAIERRSNQIPFEAFRRQRIVDAPVLKRDLDLMEFKSESFFFSRVCDFEENDEDTDETNSKALIDKYNLEKKIRRNKKSVFNDLFHYYF